MSMVQRVSTGIEGLDEILKGGLLVQHSYLVQGGPGTGKSTIGYHFLQQGNRNGEETLLISLNEQKESIQYSISRFGIDLSSTHILDLSPGDDLFKDGETYNVFSSRDVEQKPILEEIREAIEKTNPSRVVLDSVTMLNMLNKDPYRARKLALSLIRFICSNGATLLMLSEQSKPVEDSSFWVSGIISLQYSENWRNIEIKKFRGSDFQSGKHSFKITSDGIEVFPMLKPKKYERTFAPSQLGYGIEELNAMLNGGLERGTTTLMTGPSGVGKTNLGIQFIRQAAARGERSAIYSFEESKEVIISRSEGIDIPIRKMVDNGNLKIAPIEPLSYSPDEFSKIVKTDVEENDTRIVMIDSVGGYKLAVGEKNALSRLHSLCVYLQNMGVTTILVYEISNIFGDLRTTDINASYLADNILFLRYMELDGALRKSIGVLKKRLSGFDKQLREFKITDKGIVIGNALQNMRGVLTGVPEFKVES